MVYESNDNEPRNAGALFPFRLSPTARGVHPAAPRAVRKSLSWLLPAAAALCLVGGGIAVVASLRWTGSHSSPLAVDILETRIIGGAVPVAIYALALAALLFLLVRRPTRRRARAAVIGIAGGAALGGAVLCLVAATNALGVALSVTSSVWAVAGFSGVGLAVSSFWSAKGWRAFGSGASIVLVVLAGTIGINADFGLDPTVGDLAGISTQKPIHLPVAKSAPVAKAGTTMLDGGALWANWKAPASMPAEGSMGQIVIPNSISGFKARPAGLYLPPAALVPNPPQLPLVIMMMGQPGNPDPSFQAAILNKFAARHQGLAPIVLVADQIGNPTVDPLCINSARYGNAETYLTQDVVDWARTHLHVLQDPAHWTIAGYSNGGECALSLGAKYPNIWGNVLDISGERYPGSDHAAATLATDFHGNSSAYEATWPLNILAHGTYPNTVGIFTVSSNDYEYLPGAKAVYAGATAAHWNTTFFEVLNGGHVLGALNGGLTEGYTVLYPRLGLSDPGVVP
jgi:enterochelin esterase-like enzyme